MQEVSSEFVSLSSRQQEKPLPPETLLDESDPVIFKLKKRIENNVNPYIIFTDVDGTLYIKTKTDDGWKKEGNNQRLQELLSDKNIPYVVVSGRPDWLPQDDNEMKQYGLEPPDVVIVGAGTLIYWRNNEGELVLDKNYLKMMTDQEVTLRKQDGPLKSKYGEVVQNGQLRDFLDSTLIEFKTKGLTQVKIDENQGCSFVTLDISGMGFDDLRILVRTIQAHVGGIRVTFSENIEEVSEEKFSGWMQIIPAAGGKDKATRYVLEQIASIINPGNEENKKPHALCFGDAAIDILLLALGVKPKDPYKVTQYLPDPEPNAPYQPGFLTPYAKEKLKRVFAALNATPLPPHLMTARRAHLERLPPGVGYPEALVEIVKSLE